MANYVFRLPDIGEGIAEAEIIEWHVKAGDDVIEGQALVDVMTDKATVEISSPVSGRVISCQGGLGSKARVGSDLVTFETAGGTAGAGVDRETRSPPAPMASPDAAPAARPEEEQDERPAAKILAAPAVRARAKFLGLALESIDGSGPGGRVRHEDLDRLLQKRQVEAPSAEFHAAPGGEEIPVFGLRRRIAERMQEAHRRIPHFTYVEEVDVTALEESRRQFNHSSAVHLTILPFLIRALANALPRHPEVNAHYDEEAGVIHRFAALHVGIATQTERGLLVPVVRDAQTLSLQQLSQRIADLGDAARQGKSRREDLTGSTITVTSLGALGGIAATPIINPPEVAIVGVNRIAERPAVRDGTIVIARMMNLSSSFDHRIVDGYDAAAFISTVKRQLEEPERLMAVAGKPPVSA